MKRKTILKTSNVEWHPDAVQKDLLHIYALSANNQQVDIIVEKSTLARMLESLSEVKTNEN